MFLRSSYGAATMSEQWVNNVDRTHPVIPDGTKTLLRTCDRTLDLQTIQDIYPLLGYLEQGLLVKDPKKLRQNYLKSGYIYIDILSILPTDLAYTFLSTECFERVPCPVIVRLNRVNSSNSVSIISS